MDIASRSVRLRRAAVATAGVLAITALAAPTMASAAVVGVENSVYWVGGAVLLDRDTTAYLAVGYECEAGSDVDVTVELVQGGTRQGETITPVTCSGKPGLLNVRVKTAGETWQFGRATVYVDITGNALDATIPHPIFVTESIHDYPEE